MGTGGVLRVCAVAVQRQALMSGERDKLLHIEEKLTERVVGQAEAVTAVSNAIRLSRAGLNSAARPIAGTARRPCSRPIRWHWTRLRLTATSRATRFPCWWTSGRPGAGRAA